MCKLLIVIYIYCMLRNICKCHSYKKSIFLFFLNAMLYVLYSLLIVFYIIFNFIIIVVSHVMHYITLFHVITCSVEEKKIIQKTVFFIVFLIHSVVLSQTLAYINNSTICVLYIYVIESTISLLLLDK